MKHITETSTISKETLEALAARRLKPFPRRILMYSSPIGDNWIKEWFLKSERE